jgi:phosphate transport system permease protein
MSTTNESAERLAAQRLHVVVPPKAETDSPERVSAPSRRARPPLGQGLRTPLSHRLGELAIHAMALAAVLAIALIFLFIAREALPILFDVAAQEEIGGLSALVVPRQWPGYDEPAYVWQPVGEIAKLNLVPLFVGTLKVTLLSILFAVPLAVGAAIYVSQYASRRAREVLKPAIELLASIPSVVLGFFALILLATFVQDVLGTTYRLNVIVASCGLTLAIAPLVFTISEDALSAVPKDLVHAALALGARKHQVVLRVVVPAALPGIAAAVILGVGRAIGETLVVLMASGNAAVVELFDPTTSARTVTATIAAELGEVTQGDPHWRVLFLLGTLLFVVTFFLNRAGAAVIERLHRRLSGGAS